MDLKNLRLMLILLLLFVKYPIPKFSDIVMHETRKSIFIEKK